MPTPASPSRSTSKPSAANDPEVYALLGDTGSGKTTWIKRQLLNPRPHRLLVWDFSELDEYAGLTRYVTLSEMVAHVAQAGRAGPVSLAVHPSIDPKLRARQFDLFCELCFRAGNLTMIVEELRFVTTPSWAPVPWQRCNLQGRKPGLRVIGTSQRPAHIDKDFLASATVIHAGCFGYPEDAAAAARAMRLPPDELLALPPKAWIEWDKKTRLHSRGALIF